MDYGEILKRNQVLQLDMIAAYKLQEYGKAINVAHAIGALYSPDDTILAGKIAYLTQMTASAFYHAGVMQQINNHECPPRVGFEPPF